MTASVVRILLLADTHLGYDSPQNPRVARRRRGPDFLANFERALRPARQREVDMVVHGGDLFYRRRVPAALIDQALTPLAEVAQAGVPVFLVPGNHEGSRIPLHLATATPDLHIFHQPGTVILEMAGTRISVSGFPFTRLAGRDFAQLIQTTGYVTVAADIRLLCVHQSLEGARVGLHNYSFRQGPEVIAGDEIPGAFDAVLAGHIHRRQLLTHDLAGRPLPAPVIYPGSIERTSFAEMNEPKGYAIVTFSHIGQQIGWQMKVAFLELPARPMIVLTVDASDLDASTLLDHLGQELAALDPDAVVRVQFSGPLPPEMLAAVSSAALRSLAPPTMNVYLIVGDHS